MVKLKSIILGIVILTSINANACGGWDYGNLYYDFYHQELIGEQSLFPYLKADYDRYYYSNNDDAANMPNYNLEAYQFHLGKKYRLSDINQLLLDYPLDSLCAFDQAIRSKTLAKLPKNIADNLLARDMARGKHLDFLDYFDFARRVGIQSSAFEQYYWDEVYDNRDYSSMGIYLNDGLKCADDQKNIFLKKRYAFQALRMARYSNKGDEVKRIWNDYFEETDQDYIYFRALEQLAGVYYWEESPIAPYYFSRVFDALPDRRESCMNSFRFSSQESWDNAFELCQNAQEEAVFYFMRAFQNNLNGIQEIENIFEIDPNSIYLDVILARHMNEINQAFYTYESFWSENEYDFSMEQLIEDKRILEKLINAKKGNTDLYKYSLAFVHSIMKEYNQSDKLLKKLRRKDEFELRADILLIVNRIKQLDSLSLEDEDDIFSQYLSNREYSKCHSLLPFIRNRFETLYEKNNEFAKAYLCNNHMSSLKYDYDLETLDSLELFFKRDSRTSFETFIKASQGSLESSLDLINDLRGSYYFLQKADYSRSIGEFKKLSKYNNTSYQENQYYLSLSMFDGGDYAYFDTPFWEQSDGEHNNIKEFLRPIKNRLDLVILIQELDQTAKNERLNNQVRADILMGLGNVLHNLSSKGWFRPIMFHQEGNGALSYLYQGPTVESVLYREKAEFYFELAEGLYQDAEDKARAYFMILKLNDALQEVEYANNVHFAQVFKSQYGETDYYSWALRECGDLRSSLEEDSEN